MGHKFTRVLTLFLFSLLLICSVPTSIQAINITQITDNRSSYPEAAIPAYEKFEISFTVTGSVATNYFTPYSSTLPPGVRTADQGITVDGLFLPPGEADWTKARRQPAFYYQPFEYQIKSGQDWFYPQAQGYWLVRYAPSVAGNWSYRLEVTDASGNVQTSPQTFSVTASANPGFIRVSQSDPRYFEFDNGRYFPGLGYNLNYNQVDWVNPVQANQSNFVNMGQNGVQLIRLWLSQWSIFGAGWNPWKSFTNHAGDPPLELLSSNTASIPDNGKDISLIVGTTYPCVFHGSGTAPIPVKRNTNYRLKLRYFATNMSGQGGLVVKQGGWVGCDQATPISPVVNQNTADWIWLEGTVFNSGANDFINHLYLHLNNMTTGRVRVAEVELWELDANQQPVVNVLQKPSMDHHRYIDQRNSFAFDRVVELAKANQLYLRPVIADHRDWIFTHIDHNGLPTDDYAGNSFYFYGPEDQTISKTRWYNQAWWRYLQARWGYSPQIQSWEYVNEGDPGAAGHRITANMMGQYFASFRPQTLAATSVWSGSTSSWNLAAYPGVAFGDVHRYIPKDTAPAQYFDAAEAALTAARNWGASSVAVQNRWPVIRGETGFIDSNADTNSRSLELTRDTTGVWLHNFLWAGLNSQALTESYWYANSHIYCTINRPEFCAAGTFDNRKHYRPINDFLSDIPLNAGGYQDIAATGYDSNLIRVVGQKNPTQSRAHLWIQNRKHIWCAVVGNIPGCPTTWDNSRLAGTVTIPGMPPNTSLPVEYWTFDTQVNLVKLQATLTTDASGNLNVNLAELPQSTVDVALKIGRYSSAPSPTPTPTSTPRQGDANNDGQVDGLDYMVWLLNYGRTNASGPSQGDFNSDTRVDGIDYVIWLNNYDR